MLTCSKRQTYTVTAVLKILCKSSPSGSLLLKTMSPDPNKTLKPIELSATTDMYKTPQLYSGSDLAMRCKENVPRPDPFMPNAITQVNSYKQMISSSLPSTVYVSLTSTKQTVKAFVLHHSFETPDKSKHVKIISPK